METVCGRVWRLDLHYRLLEYTIIYLCEGLVSTIVILIEDKVLKSNSPE